MTAVSNQVVFHFFKESGVADMNGIFAKKSCRLDKSMAIEFSNVKISHTYCPVFRPGSISKSFLRANYPYLRV